MAETTDASAAPADFMEFLAEELAVSEKLRSNILILLFGILTLVALAINLFFMPFVETIPDAKSISRVLLLFFVGVFAYELIIRGSINWMLKRNNRISPWIRYGNALEEASIPSIGIIGLSYVVSPLDSLLGPASFLYFVFILLGALRLDFKISLFTGLVSAVEYLALFGNYIGFSVAFSDVSFFTAVGVVPKCGILILAGVLTGVVTLEIKRRIRTSFNSIQEQNRLLEQKVAERTLELETLNRDLERRVEEAVLRSRESEQLLVQQSKMSAMGEMIGMIAHQWKQPLASIAAMVANLKILNELDQMEKSAVDQFTTDIDRQIKYLSDTITDFRKFLSPTKKKEESNFGEIIENALKIIGKSLEIKNIAVEKNVSYRRSIETFPNELIQVVINLLKNAQDACLEKEIDRPTIVIEGGEANGCQRLSIKDNAGGLPDDIMNRIFDPYFTTKAEKDGTGLGLYMSKTIVEKHCQGTLTVSNLNQGACFEINLPVS
ncbi:MAG: GHKL domain-containing protein [Proteobacteria bacterium]|nr:GHKL domain-containing protein [Pseudomonadota bacterium]